MTVELLPVEGLPEVHEGDDLAALLIAACERAMWVGIGAARAYGRLGDISAAIEQSVAWSARADGRRYGSVAGYGGHGIGTAMHMAPYVANQGKRGKGPRLLPGTALAIADIDLAVTHDKKLTEHVDLLADRRVDLY